MRIHRHWPIPILLAGGRLAPDVDEDDEAPRTPRVIASGDIRLIVGPSETDPIARPADLSRDAVAWLDSK